MELLSNDDDTELYEIDKDIVGNCKLTIKRADKGAEGKYACRIVGREKEKNCFTKSEFVLKGTHVCTVMLVVSHAFVNYPWHVGTTTHVACRIPVGRPRILACRVPWHVAYLGMSHTVACSASSTSTYVI